MNDTNYGVLETEGSFVDIVLKDVIGMCGKTPNYFKVTTSVRYFTEKNVSVKC